MARYWRCVAILAGVAGVVLLLLLPMAYWLHGLRGCCELVAAAMICFLPGLAALGIVCRSSGSASCSPPGQSSEAGQTSLVALLLAMAARLVPPLMVGLLVAIQGARSPWIGLIAYMLVFYLVTLAVETWLSIQTVRDTRAELSQF